MGYRPGVATEVWMRNPSNYVRECVEVGALWTSWDFGILRKKNIDPHKFCHLYYGPSVKWRGLVIGEQGAYEIDSDHPLENPKAVYPVWEYGQTLDTLATLMADKPEGREHRVVVIRPPIGHSGIGRAFYRTLADMQSEYPDCILHVHGLYSFRIMFALGYRSVDYEPRTLAQKGKVVLPTGKEVTYEMATKEPHWVQLLGLQPVALKLPKNRCMYNIKSALWAADHFKDAIKFRTRGFSNINPDDPLKRVPRSKSIMVRRVDPQEGDKFLCDLCSLQTACKYYRQGAVCIVPESEPVELARFFKTRDSDTIIDGLGTLLAAQTKRLEKALQSEESKEELHPETTKIINTLFDRGVKLAKLVNPSLAAAGAPKVSLSQTTINAGTPQALMAAVVEQFVQQGIPRSQITPDMVLKVFQNPDDVKQRAIDVGSVESQAS